jgi:hypothetical protein
MMKIFALFVGVLLLCSFASAGIGIFVKQQSLMLNEGEEGSLSVGAYNPYSTEGNVQVSVSEELQEVLVMKDADIKYLPPYTYSQDAIPLNFYFKVPKVYTRQYASIPLIGKAIDKLECTEPIKEYDGEVIIESVPLENSLTGAGGSAAKASISHEMTVRVACNPYGWDYSVVYITVAVLSVGIIGLVLFRRYRKPKDQRIKEKMAKLKAELKKK